MHINKGKAYGSPREDQNKAYLYTYTTTYVRKWSFPTAQNFPICNLGAFVAVGYKLNL